IPWHRRRRRPPRSRTCGRGGRPRGPARSGPHPLGRHLRGRLHRRCPQRGLRAAQEQLGIQMVFQNPYASLNPRRRIGDQIAAGLALDPDRDWTVDALLAADDLPADSAQRCPHAFSGWQRQRIAIARALAVGPKVLIGDEPISSLDAFLQARIARMMRTLAIDAGASMLFISHDLAVVREIADRVAVMEAGRIVEVGTTEQIWNDPQHAYTKKLLAAIPKVDGKGIIPG